MGPPALLFSLRDQTDSIHEANAEKAFTAAQSAHMTAKAKSSVQLAIHAQLDLFHETGA